MSKKRWRFGPELKLEKDVNTRLPLVLQVLFIVDGKGHSSLHSKERDGDFFLSFHELYLAYTNICGFVSTLTPKQKTLHDNFINPSSKIITKQQQNKETTSEW